MPVAYYTYSDISPNTTRQYVGDFVLLESVRNVQYKVRSEQYTLTGEFTAATTYL